MTSPMNMNGPAPLHCPDCGYDLRAAETDGEEKLRCPECGRAFAVERARAEALAVRLRQDDPRMLPLHLWPAIAATLFPWTWLFSDRVLFVVSALIIPAFILAPVSAMASAIILARRGSPGSTSGGRIFVYFMGLIIVNTVGAIVGFIASWIVVAMIASLGAT